MGTTITIDRDVHDLASLSQIASSREARPARLQKTVDIARRLRVVVEDHWTELPADARQLLTALAYTTIEPPKWSLFLSAIRRARLMLDVLRDPVGVYTAIGETRRLTSAILDAIERNHESYDHAKARALEQALREYRTAPSMTPGEFREWLTHSSDKTSS